MIEDVSGHIFEHENEDLLTGKSSFFFNVMQKVLEENWNKSYTPLHC